MSRHRTIACLLSILASACSDPKTAPVSLAAGDEADTVLSAAGLQRIEAEVTMRVERGGTAFTALNRTSSYHVARTRTNGKWSTLVTPRSSGDEARQQRGLGRIEIDGSGRRTLYARGGSPILHERLTSLPTPPIPNLGQSARWQAMNQRFAERRRSPATEADPSQALSPTATLTLIDRRAGEAQRTRLVRAFGNGKPDGSLDVYTRERNGTTTTITFDPVVGAIVRVKGRGPDGRAVDVDVTYQQVRPGVFARRQFSMTLSEPNKAPVKVEIATTNIHTTVE